MKTYTEEEKRDHADQILTDMRTANKGILSDLFPGEENRGVRAQIITTGEIENKRTGKKLVVRTRAIEGTDDHEIMAMAAVARDPGLTQDYIDAITDFLPRANKPKTLEVQQFWNIYNNEGIINNAVNKIAAILSGGGTFKVRKAKKGKLRKAQETLQAILDDFVQNVNNAPVDAVVTGARGLQAVTHQAVRQALVEGDWIGRTIWSDKQVGVVGSFQMPVNIQSISMAEITAAPETAGTPIEAFYWTPSKSLVQQLNKPTNKDIAPLIKRYFPSDIAGKLKKDGKVFLDPALLVHVRHRGVDSQQYGESFIKPALGGIAYKRGIEALDMVSMQNLINRLTIVMVGSSDPNSPYSKSDVAAARAALMQSFFEEPGPNMTIIWQGDDIEIKDVGAHKDVLGLDDRHKIAEGKIKISLGVPEALLSGTTSDGKSAGWAAAIGAAAELAELQNAFANAWTTLGERIATENGFLDIDVIFEFDNSLMVDKGDEWNHLRNDAIAGLISIKTFLSGRGYDFDAEYIQRCVEAGIDPDPETVPANMVFAPIMGLPGQGVTNTPQNNTDTTPAGEPPAPVTRAPVAPPGGGAGKQPGAGRTPGNPKGAPKKPPKETKSPVENK